jgi:hypothetical protein
LLLIAATQAGIEPIVDNSLTLKKFNIDPGIFQELAKALSD